MLKVTTNTFTDTSLYTSILELPFIQSTEFKLTCVSASAYTITTASYIVSNTGQGILIRLLSGDDVFKPQAFRSYDEKWTKLAITCPLNSTVSAYLEFTSKDSYYKPLFNQPFFALDKGTGQNLTLVNHDYEDYPAFSFGAQWQDLKNAAMMKATNVVKTGNLVTVTFSASRSNADIKWDDVILAGLPKPHIQSAGYYHTFMAKNNDRWFTIDTLVNNEGKLLVEDSTYPYQEGLDKTKVLTVRGSFSYPILSTGGD